jgi:hypothetical protein
VQGLLGISGDLGNACRVHFASISSSGAADLRVGSDLLAVPVRDHSRVVLFDHPDAGANLAADLREGYAFVHAERDVA